MKLNENKWKTVNFDYASLYDNQISKIVLEKYLAKKKRKIRIKKLKRLIQKINEV